MCCAHCQNLCNIESDIIILLASIVRRTWCGVLTVGFGNKKASYNIIDMDAWVCIYIHKLK